MWNYKNSGFLIVPCVTPTVALDVWEHFSACLESTGVIKYKFSKAIEMSLHLVYSHFSVLNRWGVIRILVRISETRMRYRNDSHVFACKIVSTWNNFACKNVRNITITYSGFRNSDENPNNSSPVLDWEMRVYRQPKRNLKDHFTQ